MSKITATSFIRKLNSTKLSPENFLAQYRDYLINGEFSTITDPIVAKIDREIISPKQGLQEIASAICVNALNNSSKKIVKQVSKQSKNIKYLVKLFNVNNLLIEEVGMELAQNAERKGERMLINAEFGSYVKVEAFHLKKKNGDIFTTTITRENAFGKLYRNKKTPVMKKKPQYSGKLGFNMRVKNDHTSFSAG